MKRRGFLQGILAAGFAPAAIGSGILMPVRQIVVPTLAATGNRSVNPGIPFDGTQIIRSEWRVNGVVVGTGPSITLGTGHYDGTVRYVEIVELADWR